MYNRLARVIGYGEDEMDCYLIVQYVGGAVIWNTAVGGYIWLNGLKGQLRGVSTEGEDWDDFIRLEHYLHLNRAPRQETFLVEIGENSYSRNEFGDVTADKLELNHRNWSNPTNPEL